MVLRRDDIGGAPAYEPPRSETERQLTQIWQEAIGIDTVGIRDDFFLMCGSSLVAAIIFVKIQYLLGVKLPLSVLVSAPNVAELALRIDERKGKAKPC
jgi:hypothetical protein